MIVSLIHTVYFLRLKAENTAVTVLSWSSMMFPERQAMIIIIKANTFNEFFSRNKL